MIREFKFFHGITIQTEGIRSIIRTLRAQFTYQPVEELNTETELTRILSEEIVREIDEDIIRQITTDWGGDQRA
jgi:hypothetical protein